MSMLLWKKKILPDCSTQRNGFTRVPLEKACLSLLFMGTEKSSRTSCLGGWPRHAAALAVVLYRCKVVPANKL